MKKLGLIQPNFRQGPKELNAYYLPYSVGTLWAYAKQFKEITNEYKLNSIVWRRDHIDKIIDSVLENDVICFSTYVWNRNYNFSLAKRIKSLKPEITLIFGGPEIEIDNKNLFNDYPFMDIVVKYEGEITFKELLLNLDNPENVKGLLLPNKDTGAAERIQDLDELASPYLTGVFDSLINDYPDIEWNATLETNRGCPFACTFCDWGSLTYSKVKKLNLDRVYAELEWIGKNKCGFVTVTDANFGIFLERDNLIADKLLQVQEKYDYPYTFSVTWAKNQKDGVIDIVRKLTASSKFNQGLTVSVQSMDLSVLENIKRRNLDQHKIEEIFEVCEERNIPTYTEVILGLPGETLDSWKNNFWKLFKAGAHTGLNIFQAQLLENAEMNVNQVKQFDMKYTVAYDYMHGSYDEDPIKEGVKIVTETNTMPFDDMLEAQVFTWFINTFHINGLTNYISRNINIDYSEFYDKLYEYLLNDEWFLEQRNSTRDYYKKWMTKGIINHPKIAGVEIHGWNLIHRTILNAHAENKIEYLHDLVEGFLHTIIDDPSQLMKYQRLYLIQYDKIDQYPITTNVSNKKLTFDFPEDKEMIMETFLENIYFRRRRNFGKALVHENLTVNDNVRVA